MCEANAYLIKDGHEKVVMESVDILKPEDDGIYLENIFGISSCLIGLLFSYIFNVPTGAIIIIVLSVIFGLSLLFSPKRRVKRYE